MKCCMNFIQSIKPRGDQPNELSGIIHEVTDQLFPLILPKAIPVATKEVVSTLADEHKSHQVTMTLVIMEEVPVREVNDLDA